MTTRAEGGRRGPAGVGRVRLLCVQARARWLIGSILLTLWIVLLFLAGALVPYLANDLDQYTRGELPLYDPTTLPPYSSNPAGAVLSLGGLWSIVLGFPLLVGVAVCSAVIGVAQSTRPRARTLAIGWLVLCAVTVGLLTAVLLNEAASLAIYWTLD